MYEAIAEAVDTGQRRVIANHNLHSLYLYHRDRGFAQFYRRSDRHLRGRHGRDLPSPGVRPAISKGTSDHLSGSLDDLMAEIVRHDWRVFYLGLKPGVSERGAEDVLRRFKGLRIATMHGYFDGRPGSRENSTVIEAINAFQPTCSWWAWECRARSFGSSTTLNPFQPMPLSPVAQPWITLLARLPVLPGGPAHFLDFTASLVFSASRGVFGNGT